MNQIQELPSGNRIAQIWTGSEFTIAVDEENGQLWGTGWNEHANLANGCFQSSVSWVPMYEEEWELSPTKHTIITAAAGEQGESRKNSTDSSRENHRRLVIPHIWEGAVACGGGHCIAFSSN